MAAEIGPWRFVCPDNGLLTHILKRWPLHRAVELQAPRFWRNEPSPVFHGRDVFGPVAGHWAEGRAITDFGAPMTEDLVVVNLPMPQVEGQVIRGEVIGINSQIYSRTGGYMGMSFAIPIDLVLNVKDQLLAKGKVTRSRIGVAVQLGQLATAEALALDVTGQMTLVDQESIAPVGSLPAGRRPRPGTGCSGVARCWLASGQSFPRLRGRGAPRSTGRKECANASDRPAIRSTALPARTPVKSRPCCSFDFDQDSMYNCVLI